MNNGDARKKPLLDFGLNGGGVGVFLEEEMATHSSTLSWRFPWTEEPWRAAVHRVAQSRTRLSV